MLSHIIDGNKWPIAFGSHTLTSSHAQVGKESLALISLSKSFTLTYIYGQEFTLIIDHKPSTTILGRKKAASTLYAKTCVATVIGS